MNQCHECISEIAEPDAFCPFCGTSLLKNGSEDNGPAALQSDVKMEETDDSLENAGKVEVASEAGDEQDAKETGKSEAIAAPTNKRLKYIEKCREKDMNDFVDKESGVSEGEENDADIGFGTSERENDSILLEDKSDKTQTGSNTRADSAVTEGCLVKQEKPDNLHVSKKPFESVNQVGDTGFATGAKEAVSFGDEYTKPATVKAEVEPKESKDSTERDNEASAPVLYERSDSETLNHAGAEETGETSCDLFEAKEPEDDSFDIDESQSELNEHAGNVISSEVPGYPEESGAAIEVADEPMDKDGSSEKRGDIDAGPVKTEKASADTPRVYEISSKLNKKEEERSQTTPNIGGEDTDGGNRTKLKPISEGTILNARYEIVRKIGGGGMGAVYLANDRNLGGVLRAVKEMVQSYIEEEQQEKAINDFKRESMLLTSLEHPCIPTIYDYFFDEKEGRFYLVMKYISGGDLTGRLRSAPEGKLDEKSVVEWGIQIADVLDYLHNRNPPIVYRDLKPANVMIDVNSGRVMLIDFGIARWVNKEEKGVTAVGTMGYAPPELFSGNVETRSDIYSLGSTMFHLLTGADPQSNPLLIFDFQKNPRPRQINSALSDQIEQILMRSVEYNADVRFASAAELKDVLTLHLERLTSGSLSYGVKETPETVGLAEQPVFCGFCGQKIVATDMFCAFCGAKQPLAQPGVHSRKYTSAQLTAKLTVEGTSDLEAPAFLLEKDDNLIGRRDPMSNIFPEVDLSKYDPQTKISRKHARIWREGENFMVEDLNSSNGTILMSVVGDRVHLIPKKARLLKNGDAVCLGDTILQFEVG